MMRIDLVFRGATVLILALIVLSACTGRSAPPVRSVAASPAGPSASVHPSHQEPAPSTSPAHHAEGMPDFSHIFLIVMENKEYEQVIGNPEAPYINQLVSEYALADNYYGIRHPSLPNYLALLGGDTFGITSDCTTCVIDRPNLVDALEAQGKTWKSYQEDVPSSCFLGKRTDGYRIHHNPFVYFKDVRSDPARCQSIVPLTELDTDLTSGNPPDFVWITPSVWHNMHTGSVADGDRWLAGFLPKLLASDAWQQDGLVFVVWDEGKTGVGCCGVAAGGHTVALAISPSSKPGYRSPVPVTHYSLLRTIEECWDLELLGHSADPSVQPMLDLFTES